MVREIVSFQWHMPTSVVIAVVVVVMANLIPASLVEQANMYQLRSCRWGVCHWRGQLLWQWACLLHGLWERTCHLRWYRRGLLRCSLSIQKGRMWSKSPVRGFIFSAEEWCRISFMFLYLKALDNSFRSLSQIECVCSFTYALYKVLGLVFFYAKRETLWPKSTVRTCKLLQIIVLPMRWAWRYHGEVPFSMYMRRIRGSLWSTGGMQHTQSKV